MILLFEVGTFFGVSLVVPQGKTSRKPHKMRNYKVGVPFVYQLQSIFWGFFYNYKKISNLFYIPR